MISSPRPTVSAVISSGSSSSPGYSPTAMYVKHLGNEIVGGLRGSLDQGCTTICGLPWSPPWVCEKDESLVTCPACLEKMFRRDVAKIANGETL